MPPVCSSGATLTRGCESDVRGLVYRGRMKQKRVFFDADAALRHVLNSLTPEQLDLPAPAEWSTLPSPTMRDILAASHRRQRTPLDQRKPSSAARHSASVS